MTDQPDRQDGDGLLPCPFCGSDNLKSGGDDKVVGTWCLNCEASGPNQYGKWDWNTRAQSRGAAEGAGEVSRYEFPYQRTFDAIAAATDVLSGPPNQKQLSISVRKFQAAFNEHRDAKVLVPELPDDAEFLETNVFASTAPPKPAPDAMWEATVILCAEQCVTPLNDAQRASADGVGSLLSFETIWGMAQRTAKTKVLALLSAPVPPADGARQSKAPHCPDDGDPRCCYPHCLCPRSPAVAAEPGDPLKDLIDALESPDLDSFDDEKCVEARDRLAEAKVAAKTALKHRASPPVRGDRDKLYAILSKSIPQEMIDSIWQNIEQAGLVGPVQPGAGEREALESIADWCSTERAKIGAVDGYDYRSGEEFGLRCAEIEITKRALSRQAPHSPETKP